MDERYNIQKQPDGTKLYKPKRPPWLATSLTFTTDFDTSNLKNVYINDLHFVLAPKYQESCEVVE